MKESASVCKSKLQCVQMTKNAIQSDDMTNWSYHSHITTIYSNEYLFQRSANDDARSFYVVQKDYPHSIARHSVHVYVTSYLLNNHYHLLELNSFCGAIKKHVLHKVFVFHFFNCFFRFSFYFFFYIILFGYPFGSAAIILLAQCC